MGRAYQIAAKTVGDPHISLAIDTKTATAESSFECLDLSRIGGGESRNVIDTGIGNPDPVLLVDAEMERRLKGLAGLRVIALANDTAVTRIALGKVDELPLLNA